MRKQTVIGQFLAFLTAGVVVFTGVYIAILWRNQSPQRVLQSGAGQLIYKTPDMALGVKTNPDHTQTVTLLHFSPDAGWVITGTGQWLTTSDQARYAKVTLIRNRTVGPAGAMWLCAVQSDPKLTSLELVQSGKAGNPDTYDFHSGGIIEPVIVTPNTTIEGVEGKSTVLSFRPNVGAIR